MNEELAPTMRRMTAMAVVPMGEDAWIDQLAAMHVAEQPPPGKADAGMDLSRLARRYLPEVAVMLARMIRDDSTPTRVVPKARRVLAEIRYCIARYGF